ncbi:HlyD family efflux transporter periplasmic adaptor subunit [Clostridium gasigenes]|uniref:HlyD family efflux transporter periplasmic adaptor subunit n=1 Tax=Clostridium gasigenes TaxID=94869 RepID=UPI002467C41F|nr:HlyD family efflux transporter periplasmic adaptor subunit [Clostridium gasigenes]
MHINSPLTTGMVLQGGALVGTITNKEDELIIETMLPSSDNPRINNGDEVSIMVGGLLQSEYGTIPLTINRSYINSSEKRLDINIYTKFK